MKVQAMKKLSILFLLGLAFLVSCRPESYFDAYKNIPEAKWNVNDVITFEPEITKEIKAVDLTLNVRHSGLYGYSNLFLFVKTTLPNGVSRQDTVECILADKRGKWYGSGIGDIFDFEQPIGRIVAPEKGKYTFAIQQGMRTAVLEEVMDIGLSITEAVE